MGKSGVNHRRLTANYQSHLTIFHRSLQTQPTYNRPDSSWNHQKQKALPLCRSLTSIQLFSPPPPTPAENSTVSILTDTHTHTKTHNMQGADRLQMSNWRET